MGKKRRKKKNRKSIGKFEEEGVGSAGVAVSNFPRRTHRTLATPADESMQQSIKTFADLKFHTDVRERLFWEIKEAQNQIIRRIAGIKDVV